MVPVFNLVKVITLNCILIVIITSYYHYLTALTVLLLKTMMCKNQQAPKIRL